MKKIISVILSLILITSWSLTTLPVNAADGWTAVSSAQDLADINKNLSGNYFLTQNIDMTGFVWDSIGTEAFTGVLDGNGYIITNFSCESYMNRVGGLIMDNQGTVKNLCIYNFSITAKDVQYDNVGVICGLNNGTIENCHVYGTINNPAAQYVGMFCGVNYGTIKNCSAAGSVYAAYHVGGFAGQNKNLGTIQNCVNYASITIVHNRAGGIVGTMQTTPELNTAYSTASITGTLFQNHAPTVIHTVQSEDLSDTIRKMPARFRTRLLSGSLQERIAFQQLSETRLTPRLLRWITVIISAAARQTLPPSTRLLKKAPHSQRVMPAP